MLFLNSIKTELCVSFSLEVVKKSSQLNLKEIQFQFKITNFIHVSCNKIWKVILKTCKKTLGSFNEWNIVLWIKFVSLNWN